MPRKKSKETPEAAVLRMLRTASRGFYVWRVQNKDNKAYIIEFTDRQGPEAAEYFRKESARFPERFKNYELKRVHVITYSDRVMKQAAKLIRRLQRELKKGFIDEMSDNKSTPEHKADQTPVEPEQRISFHAFVKGLLHDVEHRILSAAQHTSEWTPAIDADGNRDTPDTERQVLVFLCGDRGPCDPRPSSSAGYGMRFGYFDTERQSWRVNGQFERYVTHWMELPTNPPLPADYFPLSESEEEE
jgi:hypothetical protein